MKPANFGSLPGLPPKWFIASLAMETDEDGEWVWMCRAQCRREMVFTVQYGYSPENAISACLSHIRRHETIYSYRLMASLCKPIMDRYKLQKVVNEIPFKVNF